MTDLARLNASTRDDINLLALLDPKSLAEAAAVIHKSEGETLQFIEQHDSEITAQQRRLNLAGGTLENSARRFAVKVMERFHADVDDLDTMEAANLLKVALRVIENADRIEVAKKSPHADLPIANIVINIPEAPRATIDAEVVEVKQ